MLGLRGPVLEATGGVGEQVRDASFPSGHDRTGRIRDHRISKEASDSVEVAGIDALGVFGEQGLGAGLERRHLEVGQPLPVGKVALRHLTYALGHEARWPAWRGEGAPAATQEFSPARVWKERSQRPGMTDEPPLRGVASNGR